MQEVNSQNLNSLWGGCDDCILYQKSLEEPFFIYICLETVDPLSQAQNGSEGPSPQLGTPQEPEKALILALLANPAIQLVLVFCYPAHFLIPLSAGIPGVPWDPQKAMIG